MSGFSRFYPQFSAGQLRYLAGGANSALNDQYLICDGSTVSQATYPELYAQIGLIENGNWTGTWSAITTPTSSRIDALIYNGTDLFVGAGSLGVLITSTDAFTWTARTSGTASDIFALTYGNSLYVYAGAGGVLATSTNAITWTAQTSGTASSINGLTYGNGLYVYAGNGGVLRTSTDAITWTARTSGTVQNIRTVGYFNNLYIYGANSGVLATSTDGITWNNRTSGFGITRNILALTFAEGLYIAGGDDGRIATSTDGITWTLRTTGSTSQIRSLTYTNGYYVKVGNDMAGYSTDAITWSNYNPGAAFNTAVPYNSYLIGANDSGAAYLSYASFYAYDPTTQFALPTAAITPSIKYPVTPVVYIKYR